MWSTSSSFDAPGLSAAAVWSLAYADASAWPAWNDALASAELLGPFAAGSRARVRFRTGLRLRFTLVEVEPERVFTDESRLPGARMGHRHELQPLPARDGEPAGVRLVNTIYIRGPLARLWAPLLGPQAKKGLPGWQRRAAELAAAQLQ
jgi:Polyketide cyclase / dehydrase and lipid transport